eukprot:TRINITY_DN5264_c0_g2_i3.p2 TRINITY_DN5264_c0_g2~~TRINITY_DN5264_c0_g2_i3.p2  ORF type:complete len:144 (+),score=10.18 TRINITY_DN5264_c0_g2_i3:1-432(+)
MGDLKVKILHTTSLLVSIRHLDSLSFHKMQAHTVVGTSPVGTRVVRVSRTRTRVITKALGLFAKQQDGQQGQPQIPLPKGVTLPPRQPEMPIARFGFNNWPEKMNSRAAMIGFFALLIVELAARKGLLEIMGFTVGQGLGFEL